MRTCRNLWRAGAAACLAAAVSVSPVWPAGSLFPSLAASPVTEYDEADLEKFQDNILEYWEIPGLIEQYNMSFLNSLDSFYGNPGGSTGLSRDQLLSLASDLRKEADELSRDAEDLKDDITKEEYEDYQDNIRALKGYAQSLEDDSEGTPSAIRSLKQMRNKLAKSACAMMREYQSLNTQNEIQKKSLELAELQYQSAVKQRELGLMSGEDVLSAEEALNSARASAASAKDALESQKRGLIMTLGWSYDADPEIREVPEADTAKIAGFHPETDSETAISNNYTLMEKRRTAASSFGGQNEKNRQLGELENDVRTSMDQLYRSVIQKQTAAQAAATAFEAAEADKAAADRKNQLGMSSRQEYLSAEITYLTAKAAKEAADLDLTAAIEDYEWAVEGLLDIGGES